MLMTNVRGMKSLCLAMGLMLLGQSIACSQEQRTWKDRTGQFSVDAVLSSQDRKSVSLKTADGKLINVPKTKLSKTDLDYLQAMSAPSSTLTAPAAEQLLTEKLSAGPIAVKPDEPLVDFINRLGIPAIVDRSSLEEIGMAPDVRIASDGQAASLADQLDAVLTPLDLTWYRLRTVLVVSTKEACEDKAMETLAYRIPIPRNDASAVLQRLQAVEPSSLVADQIVEKKLEQRRVVVPFATPQLASLIINASMQLVEPDSWAPLGGPGNIQHVGGKSFHVSQTQPTMRKLAQLIADLSVLR